MTRAAMLFAAACGGARAPALPSNQTREVVPVRPDDCLLLTGVTLDEQTRAPLAGVTLVFSIPLHAGDHDPVVISDDDGRWSIARGSYRWITVYYLEAFQRVPLAPETCGEQEILIGPPP